MWQKVKKQKSHWKIPGFFRRFFPAKILSKSKKENSWKFVYIISKQCRCPFNLTNLNSNFAFVDKKLKKKKKSLKNSGIFFATYFRSTYSVFSVFSVSPRFSFFNTLEVSSVSKAAKRSSSILRASKNNSSKRNTRKNFCFVLILHRLLWREFSSCWDNARVRVLARFASVVLFSFSALYASAQ